MAITTTDEEDGETHQIEGQMANKTATETAMAIQEGDERTNQIEKGLANT
jgi:hypothetical protein